MCSIQVYKRKTEAAKKEYLKALAAYKANQLSQVRPITWSRAWRLETGVTINHGFHSCSPQPVAEEMETAPSSPPQVPTSTPAQQAPRRLDNLEATPLAAPCSSSIILNVPEMKAHFYTGADKAVAPPTAAAAPPAKITKIIIPKHMLQAGGQLLTVLPGGVGTFQPTLVVSGAPRQPPPLQQMQSAPPPPRLQQMAPTPPPPLQAKPREGAAASVLPVSLLATSPPPLQIKIVPASIQDRDSLPIIVPDTDVLLAATTSARSVPAVPAQGLSPAATSGHALPSEEVNVEWLKP